MNAKPLSFDDLGASFGGLDRDDPGIHDAQSFFVHDHRIEVHFPDLRMFRHEVGNLYEELSQGRDVGRLSSTNTSENPGSADFGDHLCRILLG